MHSLTSVTFPWRLIWLYNNFKTETTLARNWTRASLQFYFIALRSEDFSLIPNYHFHSLRVFRRLNCFIWKINCHNCIISRKIINFQICIYVQISPLNISRFGIVREGACNSEGDSTISRDLKISPNSISISELR